MLTRSKKLGCQTQTLGYNKAEARQDCQTPDVEE